MSTGRELNFYNDEKSMFRAFLKKWKEFNFDIVTGWNVENFDITYLINRMKKIDFDINELSNFVTPKGMEVSCRKIVYNGGRTVFYDNVIPGIDLIDMIPVMKKANCYSAQPASFSLDSTVRWYLKDEKKLSAGPEAWENDFEKFIEYNIQDVRLVKLLIDKYELMTFIYIFQLRAANGMPLKLVVHNSVVLFYKIKQEFPDIVLPDNFGKFEIEKDNIIDLNEYDIKIKAAVVIPTTPGVHENVVSFDFQSLYPTIMRTFNLSPDTLDVNGDIIVDDIEMDIINAEGERKINVEKRFNANEQGIYPQICENLMENRIGFKAKMVDAAKEHGDDSFEYKTWAYRSDTQKQQLNSLYGVGAFKRFPIYNPFVAGAITSISRKLINFVNDYCSNKGYTTILGDTDSIYIKMSKEVSEATLVIELNSAIREYVLKKWPMVEKYYCLNFEYEKTFEKFIIKSAKKKYFGIDKDGKMLVKGFSLIQHSTPIKIKRMLEDIFRRLISDESTEKIKKVLIDYKKEFKKMSAHDIAIELRLANNPEEYDTKVQHALASVYSNKYLGTNLKAGNICKFLYIKDVKKYYVTPFVALEEDTVLPVEFAIDYDKMWKKLVLDPLKTLEELKELNIKQLISEERSLEEFGVC